MMQTPGNVSLPALLMQQESQHIVDQGRLQDQKKQQQQMDQQQQTQQTVQKMLAQQALSKQPVNNEVSGKLMQMSAKQQEQEQIKEWQDKFETNMKIAEALAPTDHVAAAEYRKEALGYKGMARDYAKELIAEHKEKAKDEGAALNVMWQSPEGYASGMENLRQVNPELASKLEQKYPQGLTLGATREIQAEATSRMSIEQQTSKTIAIEKAIADQEYKQEKLKLDKERIAEMHSRTAQAREDKNARRSETKTKEERQNAAYVKTENALIKEYDNDYDSLSREYRKTKVAFDKAVGPDKETYRTTLQEIVDKQAQLGHSHSVQLEKAKADALAQGATHPRLYETSKPKATVSPSKIDTVYNTTVGQPASAVIAQIRAATKASGDNKEYSDAEILEYAKAQGVIATEDTALSKEKERLKKIRETAADKTTDMDKFRSYLGTY